MKLIADGPVCGFTTMLLYLLSVAGHQENFPSFSHLWSLQVADGLDGLCHSLLDIDSLHFFQYFFPPSQNPKILSQQEVAWNKKLNLTKLSGYVQLKQFTGISATGIMNEFLGSVLPQITVLGKPAP